MSTQSNGYAQWPFLISSSCAVVSFFLFATTLKAQENIKLAVKVNTSSEPIANGPYQAEWSSLETQYQVPEWFRNAKFGIWAHWSAQCVPEHGDWYARKMYIEGDDDYKFQLEHFGHPSKVGFKDLDHQWKAENWEPEKLMGALQACRRQVFRRTCESSR